jgi:hypothetical protein
VRSSASSRPNSTASAERRPSRRTSAAEEWAKRYGRAARLGKNPSKPKTRIKETGEDAHLLLRYVHRYLPALCHGEQVPALRRIFVQNYVLDARDRLKWREPEGTWVTVPLVWG